MPDGNAVWDGWLQPDLPAGDSPRTDLQGGPGIALGNVQTGLHSLAEKALSGARMVLTSVFEQITCVFVTPGSASAFCMRPGYAFVRAMIDLSVRARLQINRQLAQCS